MRAVHPLVKVVMPNLERCGSSSLTGSACTALVTASGRLVDSMSFSVQLPLIFAKETQLERHWALLAHHGLGTWVSLQAVVSDLLRSHTFASIHLRELDDDGPLVFAGQLLHGWPEEILADSVPSSAECEELAGGIAKSCWLQPMLASHDLRWHWHWP